MKEQKIYYTNEPVVFLRDFILIGYSIRDKEGVRLYLHKPGCRILTADTGMQPCHPLQKKLDLEWVGDYIVPNSDYRFNFELIKKLYDKVVHKSDYSIFGYAISKDDICKYILEYHDPPPGLPCTTFYRYGYALSKQMGPIGKFMGYDVIDIGIGSCSLLVNMTVDWRIAEGCGKLNENHLFSDYQSAVCFKEKGNDLEPTHAPYAVWAIYEIQTDMI